MLASLLFPYDDDAPGLIESWLDELEQEKCIVRYCVDGGSYIQICNWLIHQKIDKPSRSRLPEFDGSSRILANPRECSSGDQRIKGSKDQGSISASATPARKEVPRETDLDWWLDFKLAYPHRAGDQGWRRAQKAANARQSEGHAPDEFLAGAKRYAAFCEATGKTGTEYVKQAASFLGPEKPFLEPWTIPAQPAGRGGLEPRRPQEFPA